MTHLSVPFDPLRWLSSVASGLRHLGRSRAAPMRGDTGPGRVVVYEAGHIPLLQLAQSVEQLTPRELVIMLHHLDQIGALYTDPETRDRLAACIRNHLLAVECQAAPEDAWYRGWV